MTQTETQQPRVPARTFLNDAERKGAIFNMIRRPYKRELGFEPHSGLQNLGLTLKYDCCFVCVEA